MREANHSNGQRPDSISPDPATQSNIIKTRKRSNAFLAPDSTANIEGSIRKALKEELAESGLVDNFGNGFVLATDLNPKEADKRVLGFITTAYDGRARDPLRKSLVNFLTAEDMASLHKVCKQKHMKPNA